MCTHTAQTPTPMPTCTNMQANTHSQAFNLTWTSQAHTHPLALIPASAHIPMPAPTYVPRAAPTPSPIYGPAPTLCALTRVLTHHPHAHLYPPTHPHVPLRR